MSCHAELSWMLACITRYEILNMKQLHVHCYLLYCDVAMKDLFAHIESEDKEILPYLGMYA